MNLSHFILDYLALKFESFFLLQYLLNYRHEKRIENLQEEAWFEELYSDLRYSYIINHNKKIRRFISKHEKDNLLKTNEQIRENFINMVKQEHAKFVGIK